MLFEIVRTSVWDDSKPYEKCFPIKLKHIDIRNFTSYEEYYKRTGKNWEDDGTNHHINEQGFIEREYDPIDSWGIRLDTLEDLLNFQKDVGEDIIIRTSYTDNKTPCIEIYDDYRE